MNVTQEERKPILYECLPKNYKDFNQSQASENELHTLTSLVLLSHNCTNKE